MKLDVIIALLSIAALLIIGAIVLVIAIKQWFDEF